MKAISVRPRQSWPEGSDIPAGDNVQERPRKTPARDEERITSSDTNFSIVPTIAPHKSGVSTDRGLAPNELSVRAENILKVLAAEVTGEIPPRGRWIPSNALLKKLTYRHISTARNCGPQATAEIVKWAESREPSFAHRSTLENPSLPCGGMLLKIPDERRLKS